MGLTTVDTQDTSQLLAELKGIHLPPPPVTPDLWPVALAITVCVGALLLFITRFYQQRRSWHLPALSKLNTLQQESPPDALWQTASLLRRIVLTEKNNQATKHLSGPQWLQYLDHFFNTDYFSNAEGRIFGEQLYQPGSTLNDGNYRQLKKLIKRHRWRQ